MKMKLQATLFIATCFLHYVQSASLGAAAEVPLLEEAPQEESNTQEYQAVENPKADESASTEDPKADETDESESEGRYGSMMNEHGSIGSMNDWRRSKGSMMNGHGFIGSMNDWHRSKGAMMNGYGSQGPMNDWNHSKGSMNNWNENWNDWNRNRGSMRNGISSQGSMNGWNRLEGSMHSDIGSPGSMNDWYRSEGSMNSEIGSPGSMNGWHRSESSMNRGIGSPGSMNDWNRSKGSTNIGMVIPGSMNDWDRSEDSMDYSSGRDSAKGRPTEHIALVNYFLKKVFKEKAARQNILREMNYVDSGSNSADLTAKQMAHAGIFGITAGTPTHIKQLVGIMEKRIPNERMRHKLYNSLATIKLGDIKANEVGPVAYMLDSMSK